MTVTDLLKHCNKLPDDTDVFIADSNITSWPIQIPIDKVLYDEKHRALFLVTSDTQTVLPEVAINELVFRT